MADDLSSLLGGLLNIQQQPQVNSGLLGGLNQALSPYGGQMGLGLSLLANSNTPGGFGSILGRSALEAQQQQFQNQQQRIALAQSTLGLGSALQRQQLLQPFLNPGAQAQAAVAGDGAPPPSAGGVAPQQAAPNGGPGPISAPQMAMPPGQPQGQPQGSGGIDLDSVPIQGMPARAWIGLAIAGGKDPLEAQKNAREIQLQTVQQSVKPQLAQLDTIVKSDKPAQYVRANPQLSQIFAQLAPGMGINPNSGLTDANVRAAFGAKRNQLAGSVGLGTEAPTVQEQTINGSLGSIYQRDPVSGKLTQVKGEEGLKDVVDPNTGLPTNVRASAAEGKQPYNAQLFGASNVSDQALQFAADTYRTTGKFPTSMARNALLQGKVLNKVAADAAATGDTAGAIAARGSALKANGQALDQVTKQEALTTSYYTTLEKNLNNLAELAGKVDSSGSPLVNKVYRAWQQGVTGDPDVAKYVTYMRAAEGEYAKIQSGSMGNQGSTDAARRDAQDVINKYMSQGQILAVREAMLGEGQNRLSSIREEKQGLMGSLQAAAPGTPSAQPPSSGGLSVGKSQQVGQFTVTRVK